MLDPQTPEWVRDAIFYQIFPDRFARSLTVPKSAHLDEWGAPPTYHGYQGGDLIGVVEHLDYLCDLGINAVYFTPIFQSASNHRYHTHDYEKVDPMLGGTSALRRLIDAAHARGIRVVLDGVFNHASRGFFPFHDILENGPNSAYLDWFTVKSFPLQAYDAQKVAQLFSLVGFARSAQVQYRLPRGTRVPLGHWPDVDRVRHRWLAARRPQRNQRRRSSGASFGRVFEPPIPRRISSAKSGPTPSDGSKAICGTPS